MTAPNMAAITASLERSLQNFSLNHQSSSSDLGYGCSATSDSPPPEIHHSDETTLELNSHISLPYHWEQCLDLKTGEVYYINWRTGMKAKEDPRTSNHELSGEIYSEEDDSSYDSDDDEGSSTESSPSSSSKFEIEIQERKSERENEESVLVVGGCKRCLMYLMVAKQVEECPKCGGQLLHFDNASSVLPLD